VFALFGRKRSETPRRPPLHLGLGAATVCSPEDPQDQIALVQQAVEKLDQVGRMVQGLPEVPLGDRQTLLTQIALTSDHLRSLYFLDAIY